jgi:predicted nucleic acid-binding protein
MTLWLADTSVAVAAVLVSHTAHDVVNRSIGDRPLRLPAHAALETYSVLTRLPGDARLDPADAARLLGERFGQSVTLTAKASHALVAELARLRIAGGAVYDALIAKTALASQATLLTRDSRAVATYKLLSVNHELLTG